MDRGGCSAWCCCFCLICFHDVFVIIIMVVRVGLMMSLVRNRRPGVGLGRLGKKGSLCRPHQASSQASQCGTRIGHGCCRCACCCRRRCGDTKGCHVKTIQKHARHQGPVRSPSLDHVRGTNQGRTGIRNIENTGLCRSHIGTESGRGQTQTRNDTGVMDGKQDCHEDKITVHGSWGWCRCG